MMGGIDSSFDGVILIGIHAGASNMEGVLAHTLDGDLMTEVSLNGVVMSEAGICAATAGEYDVPVIMVSGDSAAADETVALLGKIETAVVKEPISYTSAKTLLPSAANALIKSKVKSAMKEIDKAEPYKLQAPITLEIKFNNYTVPQKLSNLSAVERVDARTIHFVAKDMTEVWKFFTLAFSIEY
jgi:D-amino peptidase